MGGILERRRSERRRVCYAGQIAAPSAFAPVADCSVHNLSALGALVAVEAHAPLTFDLRTTRDGAVRRARTVWRTGARRGVAFLDALAPQCPPPAPGHPAGSIPALRRALKIVVAE